MRCTFIVLFISFFISNVNSQDTGACCRVIGKNPVTKSVTVINNTTGKLFMFRANNTDLESIKFNDAISTNNSYTYVTAINGIQKQYFAGPINLTQKTDGNTVGLVNLDFSLPCCVLIDVNALSIAQNLGTGKTFSLPLPQQLVQSLTTGTRIFTTTVNSEDYAVIRIETSPNSSLADYYVFPINKEPRNYIQGPNWEMKVSNVIRENYGRLVTDFPPGVEWGIDIYRNPEHKFLLNKSVKGKTNYYEMSPGNYDFKLGLIDIKHVPIEFGMETRLKAGYLDFQREDEWSIFDGSGSRLIMSVNRPVKLALPPGNYKVKMNGEFVPFVIEDQKTTTLTN